MLHTLHYSIVCYDGLLCLHCIYHFIIFPVGKKLLAYVPCIYKSSPTLNKILSYLILSYGVRIICRDTGKWSR